MKGFQRELKAFHFSVEISGFIRRLTTYPNLSLLEIKATQCLECGTSYLFMIIALDLVYFQNLTRYFYNAIYYIGILNVM